MYKRPLRIPVFIKLPQNVFLVVASIFGLALIAIIPPFQGADEQTHYLRAYHLSDFNVKADIVDTENGPVVGGMLPQSVTYTARVLQGYIPSDTTAKFDVQKLMQFRHTLETRERVPTGFIGAALYSPVAYLPQTASLVITRALHLPILVQFYIARLAGLLFFISLTYWAIRIMPFARWLLAAVALLPAVVFQSAVITADIVVFSLCFALIALFASVYQGRKLAAWQVITSLAVVVFLAFAKSAYAPLALIFVLVPRCVFASTWRYVAYIAGLPLAALMAAYAWTRTVQYAIPYGAQAWRPGQDVSYDRQLELVTTHPWRFGEVLFTTLVGDYNSASAIWGSVLSHLGWDIQLPALLMIGLTALALLSAYVVDTGSRPVTATFSRLQLGVIFLAIGLSVSVIAVSLYTTFSVVNARVVSGIQGRYFIPLLAPLILLTGSKNLPMGRINPRVGLSILVVGQLLLVTIVIFRRYYV